MKYLTFKWDPYAILVAHRSNPIQGSFNPRSTQTLRCQNRISKKNNKHPAPRVRNSTSWEEIDTQRVESYRWTQLEDVGENSADYVLAASKIDLISSAEAEQ